ncbi:MAG: UvrD-helicase domain-containing protein [Dehalococcoidales bacterium]|nr:UvrD-helicase domain-containing protein [Dehalococcoidales bacterium]
MNILAGLNPAQKEAVEAIKGPVLILAGPGSGKTRVITQRVAYLVKECGVSPRHIMAVTFTNKAAREMTERLNKLVSTAVKQLTMGTFHAICARILRQDGEALGIDPHFVIYDDDDQISLIKKCLQELNLDPKQNSPSAIQNKISFAKSQVIDPQEYLTRARSYFEEVVGRVYERYQQMIKENTALDFDDLLMQTVQLLKNHPKIRTQYQERYLHLLVDEFQDTNMVQYELIKLIGGKHRNICVVGDPDQSIYSWRSADLRNILGFEKDFPEAKVILLEQNYRSTKTILAIATNIIEGNKERKPKDLWTENEAGEKATIVETYNEQEEAQFVVSEVDKLVRARHFQLGDCAVMYRTNAQSRALEEAFIRYGLPYKLVAGTRFYERKEVKDIIAYLRYIQNPNDGVSLHRIINVPGRGIGQRTLSELNSLAKSLNTNESETLQMMAAGKIEKMPFNSRIAQSLASFTTMINELREKSKEVSLTELFDMVTENSGYKDFLTNDKEGEERWENILELRTVAKEYGELPPPTGLAAFLEGVTLVADVDSLDGSTDAVTLITLHQAKGLEYPAVFIVGMEEGVLPHLRSFDDPAQMEEERRLCYVGVTRAKQKVYLIRAFRRNLMGGNLVNEPSRFLKDIPKELIVTAGTIANEESIANAISSWNKTAVFEPTTEIPEFKAGDRVKHARFGEGMVVSYQTIKNDAEAVVAFNGIGVKKLLLSFAKLEKI